MSPQGPFAPEASLLPIVPSMRERLDAGERRHIRKIAAEVMQREPALAGAHPFGRAARSGMADGLWLVIGDTREIALAKPGERASFEHRLSFLARGGDMVVWGEAPHEDFERYRAERLGLGSTVNIVARAPSKNALLPLAARCLLDAAAFSQIVEKTKEAGGLTIVPHIGMGSVWRLAAAIAQASGRDILVASPGPHLTRRVNDKLWFARLAGAILGETTLPPTYAAYGPAALAHRIRALARTAERVVVKVPDSAGGMGNLRLSSQEIRGASLCEIKNRILCALCAAGWCHSYPLLFGVWEAPTLASPSVQLWIPALEDGAPIIEGLFEQVLEGERGSFVGSVPADLPEQWRRQLARGAMRLAVALQLLGYFGRCSLDALLVGRSFDGAVLHWIECNGRWGGVSIPMTVTNRLSGGIKRDFVVVQRTQDHRPPRPFADALHALDPVLFTPGRRETGAILLSPVEIEEGRGVQMLACAQTIAAARELSTRALEILRAAAFETPRREPAVLPAQPAAEQT